MMEIQPSTKTIIARYSASIPLVCEMDFDQFPFDESICKIQMFNSQNSNNTMIFIDDNELDNEEYDQFHTLNLAKFEVKMEKLDLEQRRHSLLNSEYSVVGFKLRLTRNSRKYLIDIYLPSGAFVCLSWMR